MERRGEGFERERYVPERPEPRYQSAERERIPERRPTEPMATYDERRGFLEPGIVLRARDMTSWGPVIAGFFGSLSIMFLMAVLGAAIGLQVTGAAPGAAAANAGVGAAVWGAITLIVSFFVGGWLAGRTAAIAGPMMGLIHGFGVWALTISVVLILGAFGFVGALGSLMGAGVSPAAPGSVNAALVAGWGTFAALILGLAFALFGGWVGGNNVPAPRSPAR